MNSLYGTKKFTNVCSGNVVFRNTKDDNGELISMKQYIEQEYNRRVLYLRDMALAKKQIPFIESVTLSSETNTTNVTHNVIIITFSEIVYKNVYNGYSGWGEINTSISNDPNNTNSVNELGQTVWKIYNIAIENIIGSTFVYTIPANSFQNRLGNLNLSESVSITVSINVPLDNENIVSNCFLIILSARASWLSLWVQPPFFPTALYTSTRLRFYNAH